MQISRIAYNLSFLFILSAKRPMINEPNASPPMNMETTIVVAYTVLPSVSFIKRTHTTSSIREHSPEQKYISMIQLMPFLPIFVKILWVRLFVFSCSDINSFSDLVIFKIIIRILFRLLLLSSNINQFLDCRRHNKTVNFLYK